MPLQLHKSRHHTEDTNHPRHQLPQIPSPAGRERARVRARGRAAGQSKPITPTTPIPVRIYHLQKPTPSIKEPLQLLQVPSPPKRTKNAGEGIVIPSAARNLTPLRPRRGTRAKRAGGCPRQPKPKPPPPPKPTKQPPPNPAHPNNQRNPRFRRRTRPNNNTRQSPSHLSRPSHFKTT